MKRSLAASIAITVLALNGCGGSSNSTPNLSREASQRQIADSVFTAHTVLRNPYPDRGTAAAEFAKAKRQPTKDANEPTPPKVGDRFELSDGYYGIYTILEKDGPEWAPRYITTAYDLYLTGRGVSKVGSYLNTIREQGAGRQRNYTLVSLNAGLVTGKSESELITSGENGFIESYTSTNEYRQIVNGRANQNYDRFSERAGSEPNSKVYTYDEMINGKWRQWNSMISPNSPDKLVYSDAKGYKVTISNQNGEGTVEVTSGLDPLTPATGRYTSFSQGTFTFSDGTTRDFQFDRNSFWLN